LTFFLLRRTKAFLKTKFFEMIQASQTISLCFRKKDGFLSMEIRDLNPNLFGKVDPNPASGMYGTVIK
jgi:hypothetical protein